MDFQYNFHQAHQDRLEDAGVKQYRPLETVRSRKSETQRTRIRPLRIIFATVWNFFIK